MLLLAILNGTARDLWYKKYIGDLTAHQISTASLILLFGLYIGIILKIYPPESGKQALFIGALWLILTLVFEFGVGLMRGRSWTQLLGDYKILEGRVWILVPIWITIAPYLYFKFFK